MFDYITRIKTIDGSEFISNEPLGNFQNKLERCKINNRDLVSLEVNGLPFYLSIDKILSAELVERFEVR